MKTIPGDVYKFSTASDVIFFGKAICYNDDKGLPKDNFGLMFQFPSRYFLGEPRISVEELFSTDSFYGILVGFTRNFKSWNATYVGNYPISQEAMQKTFVLITDEGVLFWNAEKSWVRKLRTEEDRILFKRAEFATYFNRLGLIQNILRECPKGV